MQDLFKEYLITKAGATEAQYEALKNLVTLETIKSGAVLLRETEVCNRAFFVCKGILRSYTMDDAGKEHIIQFASENWWIVDRSSFYFDEPSDLFIDAIEDTELVFVKKDFLEQAEKVIDNFSAFNTLALQKAIRQMQKRINYLLAASAEKKYLDFIKSYREITLRVPQLMIASYLGITPESLSREKKELARKNFNPYA